MRVVKLKRLMVNRNIPDLLRPSQQSSGIFSNASLDLPFAERKVLTDAISGKNLITFTRTSSGTYVGSDGVLKTATTNLFTQSEDVSSWANPLQFGTTITSNSVAGPTGVITADTVALGANGYYYARITYSNTGNHTASIWLRADSAQNVSLRLSNSAGTESAFVVCAVTTSWQRFSVTINFTSNPTQAQIGLDVRSLAGGSGSAATVYVWGAQLEQSSTVGEYIPTTSTINSAPRFDHNPTTGESLGLLVEEQRTNSIRNNTMVGAVAGTPGTLPTNWVIGGGGQGTLSRTIAVGESGGIPWVDFRFFGTTSTTGFILAFEPTTQIAALTGQAWTSSFYVALAGGSLTNINQLRHDIVERTSAGGSVLQNFSGDFKSTLTSSLARSTYAVTLSGGATTAFVQPSIEFNFASGVTIDITLRIGLPQLEQGAFATSVIPTTGTTATRNADVASITGTNFSSWYSQSEGTVFADVNSAPVNNIAQLTFDISEGVGNERMFQRRNASGIVATAVLDNGVTQGDIGSVVIGASARYKSGYAYKLNDLEIVVNGGGSATDTSATVPTPDRLHIGQNYASGQSCNGTLRRLTFWPARLPNSTLQQITA